MTKIILTVTNDLETDQRVNRAALTLLKAGFDVKVVGRLISQSKPFERPYSMKRFRLFFRKSFAFYAEYNLRLFFYLLFQPCSIIYSNDIDTLPAAWLAARLRRKYLVFDSHELFSEVPELVERPAIRKVWRRLEDFLIPRIDAGITVCQPIADIYFRRYGKQFHVIRNVPFPTWNKFDYVQPSETVRIIYQGAVNKGRGLFLLVDAMEFLPDAELLICGTGDEYLSLQDYVLKKKYSRRIQLLGRVDYEKLPAITRTAHVGVSLEEDLGLNYRFASPNKVYDYIQAQIPVVVSDLPVMASVVNEYGIGMVLYRRTPESLAETIAKVVDNHRQGVYNQNLKKAAQTLNWEAEKIKFLAIFEGKKFEPNKGSKY